MVVLKLLSQESAGSIVQSIARGNTQNYEPKETKTLLTLQIWMLIHSGNSTTTSFNAGLTFEKHENPRGLFLRFINVKCVSHQQPAPPLIHIALTFLQNIPLQQ